MVSFSGQMAASSKGNFSKESCTERVNTLGRMDANMKALTRKTKSMGTERTRIQTGKSTQAIGRTACNTASDA